MTPPTPHFTRRTLPPCATLHSLTTAGDRINAREIVALPLFVTATPPDQAVSAGALVCACGVRRVPIHGARPADASFPKRYTSFVFSLRVHRLRTDTRYILDRRALQFPPSSSIFRTVVEEHGFDSGPCAWAYVWCGTIVSYVVVTSVFYGCLRCTFRLCLTHVSLRCTFCLLSAISTSPRGRSPRRLWLATLRHCTMLARQTWRCRTILLF